jgi:antitoxin VapB
MVNARRHRARKRSASRSSQKTAARAAAPRRAAIFRNGRNQAVRLPQDLAFPQDVKEVQVSRRGDAIVLSPVRRDWASFFELDTAVSEDFLAPRGDSQPQSREPL